MIGLDYYLQLLSHQSSPAGPASCCSKKSSLRAGSVMVSRRYSCRSSPLLTSSVRSCSRVSGFSVFFKCQVAGSPASNWSQHKRRSNYFSYVNNFLGNIRDLNQRNRAVFGDIHKRSLASPPENTKIRDVL